MSGNDTAPAHPLANRGLYVPLDVNYADDPKVIEAGPEAELVYVRSLAISKRLGSDGAIHRAHLARLTCDLPSVAWDGADPCLIAVALVKAELWAEAPDGWQIVSWDRWNLTSGEIVERRRSKALGATLGNHRRWHEGRGKVDPDCPHCQSIATPNRTESVDRIHANPQSRDRVETESEGERGTDTPDGVAPTPKTKAPKGTRIPVPFRVSEANREWADREIAGFDWDREGPKFLDYWRAQPGAKGVKLDWDATWRNWMRRAAEGAFK